VVIHAPFYDDPKPPGGEEGTTIEIEQFCLMKLFKMVIHYIFLDKTAILRDNKTENPSIPYPLG
jgi:hypothetical protein